MKNQSELYHLFEELVCIKRRQRAIEERLFQALSRPIHRKWMHERVQDQYKHEKIICEVAKTYMGETLEIGQLAQQEMMQQAVLQELYQRLEQVTANIQLITKTSQIIDDFKAYKRINMILSDEYIYQSRLLRMLIEK